MDEPIDPADILARHQDHRGQWGDGACTSRFGGPEHCLAYLLASAVVEAEVKIERVSELAHRFELIPRARLLGALATKPKP
jgi:hypothetical protein